MVGQKDIVFISRILDSSSKKPVLLAINLDEFGSSPQLVGVRQELPSESIGSGVAQDR